MRVALLDLGIGNLHSLTKAFERALPSATIHAETDVVRATLADLLVLPGVGGWGAVAWANRREALRSALDSGLPCIGICLGMQLLFESSEEAPGPGLGFFAGAVTKLRAPRAPHMGWSLLSPTQACTWALPAAVYFAHSYACRPQDTSVIVATSRIEGDEFAVIVRKGRTIACQFHPEKSSTEGIALLGEMIRSVMS